ncbi:putative transcriptional regulator YdeE [Catalinimonas alkaloidigena]|uniref:GyrI-like domain-containing protein n=1 Tax=Catalinimonas alkaloidigena TaxID=1075417 RepID=UPI002407597F|nr:GyrI-like domain-containing protein [Catalinimonas alkaloidigena]MDF9799421.1 putative transcriptional regulator YdeE [Catalinimonas alkaloidigena]
MENKKENFRLIGLKLPHKTTNKNNQSSQDCGDLWQKFEKNKVYELIPEKLSNEIYAVYFDYEKDETMPFSYFIGCKVPDSAVIPAGLEVLTIPGQSYKKFVAKGKMTACITDTWKEIWNSNLRRKFSFDFEIYDERSQDWSDAEVDIYISTPEGNT